MKSKLKITLFSLLIAAILLPSSVFTTPVSEASSNPAPSSTAATVKVQVLSAPQTATLNVEVKQTTSCNLGPLTSNNLVQDTSLFNLNQTADCFAINSALLVTQPRLTVTVAATSSTILVVNNSQSTVHKIHQTQSLPQSLPALPLAAALVFSVVTVAIEPGARAMHYRTKRLAQSLTLSQLQVMRC